MGLEVVKCHVEGLHGVTVLSARILLETLTKPEEQFIAKSNWVREAYISMLVWT